MIPPQKTTAFIDNLIDTLIAEEQKLFNDSLQKQKVKSAAIAKQFFVSSQEKVVCPDFTEDPLQEELISPLPRLFHKYPNKILINTTDSCSVLCRFCTRKRYTQKSDSNSINKKEINDIARYVAERKNIDEIILSGGEVFLLTREKIKNMLHKIVNEQIKIVRFHTRLPIVDPLLFAKKIPQLIALKKKFRKQNFVLVFHINHSLEITPEFKSVVATLQKNHFIIKSQSVLLKDINDNENTLHSLFSDLYNIGITPYYLHHLDKITGSAHFFVSYSKGLELMQALSTRQDRAYDLPRYVADSLQGKKDVKEIVVNT